MSLRPGGLDKEREGLQKLFHCIAPARHAPKRFCYGILLLICFVTLLQYSDRGPNVLQPIRPGRPVEPEVERTNNLDLSHLNKYNLTSSFTYSRRSIDAKRAVGARSNLNSVDSPLFKSPQVSILSNTDNMSSVPVTMLPPLTLSFPSDDRLSRFYAPSAQRDSSTITFGIATKLSRLNDSIPQLSHWLSGSEATLHVLVPQDDDDDPAENFTALESVMRNVHEIKVTISATKLPVAHAYFSLVKLLYEDRPRSTQWVALFDDDTFVPSLPHLAAHLKRTYDSTAPRLVGALTDNFHQVNTWGLIPFGGGGIFLSVPLAAQLASSEVYNDCIQSEQIQGDGILNECLTKWSEVRPTYDPALNQMDLRGDVSGLFESGRSMLTIHHWKTWFEVDVPKVAKVSEACGDEGILMRFNFTDGVVLSNGYSIVEYGVGVDKINFNAVEKTWDGPAGDFLHRLGPLREPLSKDQKKSYKMVDTVALAGGEILQTYLHEAEYDEESQRSKGDDGVIELLWRNKRTS